MSVFGLYYRVSTDKQDLASQVNSVETWLKNLTPEDSPKKTFVYKDEGISGKTFKRPGFQRLLLDAYQQKIDTVVVYRLDRISRNASAAIQTLLTLDEAGVSFISVSQPVLNLGHANPFRRTMLAAFSEIAEIERDTIVDRVKSGLAAAREKGTKLGRPQKYCRQDQIEVRRLRDSGLTYQEIAKRTGFSHGSVQNLVKGDEIKN